MNRPALVALVWAALAGGGLADDPKPAPPPPTARALLDLLKQDHEAQTLADRIRCTRIAMEALLAADKQTLLEGLDIAITEKIQHPRVLCLAEECALKDREAALARIDKSDAGVALYFAVWDALARNDPDRAIARFAKSGSDPKQLSEGQLAVLTEAGAALWRRDGKAALEVLASKSADKFPKETLFCGMAGAVRDIEDRLTLLDWLTSPAGQDIERHPKGFGKLINRLTGDAALLDLPRTRAWIERRFPAGHSDKSGPVPNPDTTDLRTSLFKAWALTDPRPAADWLMAQVPPEDEAAGSFLSLCIHVLERSPLGGGKIAADWLLGHRENPDFVTWVQWMLEGDGSVSGQTAQEPTERTMTERFSRLPFDLRRRIFFDHEKDQPRYRATRRRFGEPLHGRLLRSIFPVEDERKRIEEEEGKRPEQSWDYPPDRKFFDTIPMAFKLEDHPPEPPPKPSDFERARQLAAWYEQWVGSFDPATRLEGLAALEWVSRCTDTDFMTILRAHDGNPGSCPEDCHFTEGAMNARIDRDWRSCERMIRLVWWQDSTRRQEWLLKVFLRAAKSEPDAVLAHVKNLFEESHFDMTKPEIYVEIARRGPRPIELPSDIATGLGGGWALHNKSECMARILSLPPHWQGNAVVGAATVLWQQDPEEEVEWLRRMQAAREKQAP